MVTWHGCTSKPISTGTENELFENSDEMSYEDGSDPQRHLKPKLRYILIGGIKVHLQAIYGPEVEIKKGPSMSF